MDPMGFEVPTSFLQINIVMSDLASATKGAPFLDPKKRTPKPPKLSTIHQHPKNLHVDHWLKLLRAKFPENSSALVEATDTLATLHHSSDS